MKFINEKEFKNHYVALKLIQGPQDENKVFTDEDVEKAYNFMKSQAAGFLANSKSEKEELMIKEIERRVEEAYQALRTEQGRKQYDKEIGRKVKVTEDEKQEDKRKEEMPKKLNILPANKHFSEEQFENARRATEDAAKKMEEFDSVNFTPIYKGKIGELPPKSIEDDEGR